ncbi:TonB-dependent receptor [Candidatus Eisenbacteria bacterium]|uniref:TonB-dependent receptor n=1 Tax=Eiseniibacteriota bacterium TaxID=2212470 RepID=A0ABV6YQX8_UNCEI
MGGRRMRDSMLRGVTVLIVALAVTIPFGVAEGKEPIAVRIDTVEVVDTPIISGEDITLYGGTTTAVGRHQIEELSAQDLPSALRLLPGVTISRYNLLGSYGGGEGGSVYIRGQGSGRPGSEIKVYVDGAPREVGVWSHPVMDMVPTDYASSIEVFKGPQPYNYPGTFGTVDLTTLRRSHAGYETSCNLALGEYGTGGGVFRHGGKIRAFDYYLGISYKESDGHRPHADGKIESQFLRMGLDAAGDVHVGYVLQHTDNWSRDPGRVDGPMPERDRFATETLTHNIRLDHDGGRFDGYAVLYYEDGQIRWEKDHLDGPDTPPGNSNTDWNNYGFRGTEDMTWGDFGLTAGLEIEDEGGQSRNVTLTGAVPFQYEGRFTTVAPALAARYRIGAGKFTLIPSAGLRYYDHSRFASETAPHAGLICHAAGWKLFATYARGVTYPGVYVLGIASSTIDELKAEILDHFEIGASAGFGNRIKLQTSVFRDKADNLLQWTPQGLVNVKRYEVNGLEISSTLDPLLNLSLYGAITVLDPVQEKTPRAPGLSASAGVNYRPISRWRLTVDFEHVGEQYVYNGRSGAGAIVDAEKLPSYFVINGGIGYGFSDHIPGLAELSLEIENLTNESYSFQPGYPMPGRTVLVTARLGSR